MNIDDLKCCGNCNHYEHAHLTCPQYGFSTMEGWELCENWAYDDFKQKERMQEEHFGN